MRKLVLAIVLTLAITIGPSEAALAHRLDSTTITVRQAIITVESPSYDEDDLSNQPMDSDDNHDNG